MIGANISHGNHFLSLIIISEQIVSAVLGSIGFSNIASGGEGTDVRVNLTVYF